MPLCYDTTLHPERLSNQVNLGTVGTSHTAASLVGFLSYLAILTIDTAYFGGLVGSGGAGKGKVGEALAATVGGSGWERGDWLLVPKGQDL